MEKIWLKHYPAGVPAEIDVNEFRSIGDLFDKSVKLYGPRTAYINMDKSITYAELDRLSANFGAYCQSVLKLPKGTRIALMMPNLLQYPICLYGALRAGYTVVNCNPLYTERELEHQIKDSGAEAIVIVENFAGVLERVVARTPIKHVLVTQLGDMLDFPKRMIVNLVVKHVKKMVPAWNMPAAVELRDALIEGGRFPLQPVEVGHDDLAFLQYTGGTTGVSKGAMLTHRNIIANLQQAHGWIAPFLREHEIIITALPLYHIFALTANCLTFFKIGATNVLITNPRDIPGFIKEIGKYRFSTITGVNTLFNAMVNNPDFAKIDLSQLHLTLGGGMAVQRAVAERWKQITGATLIEAYGLTETSPAATMNPIDIIEYNGTIGLPISSTEVVIRNDRGEDLPLGEAIARIEEVSKNILPVGYYGRRAGQTEILADSYTNIIFALILALIFSYMILAAQFENFIHPFSITLSLPLAVVGALHGGLEVFGAGGRYAVGRFGDWFPGFLALVFMCWILIPLGCALVIFRKKCAE